MKQLKAHPTKFSLQAESTFFKDLALAGLCFFLTLSVALYIQLSSIQPRMLLMLDSGHFFLTCQLLCKQILNVVTLRLQPDNFLGDCLMQDGPVLSLVPAMVYSLLGIEPLSTNWQVVAFVQCFYHAVSAALVYLIAARILNSSRWALLAGVLWGLNPAGLVNCGRFLTEGLALVLILAGVHMMLQAARSSDRPLKRIAFGVFAGLFQGMVLLTKPPLIFACALSCFVSWAGFPSVKLRTQFLASLIVGSILALLPWAIVTKQVVGEVHVVPKRCAVHNLVKGLNYQADAWQSFPLPPLTALYSNWFGYESGVQELWSVGQAVVKASPAESLFLAARKIPRLFFLPWNDFDGYVGLLDPQSQVFFHYFLVSSALLGILGFLVGIVPSGSESASNSRLGRIGGFICLSVILGHFAYLPFEAMPRYWFSAMPFMVIFAVLFWHYSLACRSPLAFVSLAIAFTAIALSPFDLLPHAISIMKSTEGGLFLEFLIKTALILACLGSFAFIQAGKKRILMSTPARICLPLASMFCVFILWASIFTHKSPREWKCVLSPGEAATRSVYLEKGRTEPARAYIIVDSDNAIGEAKVFVNGHEVKNEPFPIFQLNKVQFWVSGFFRTFASAKGLHLDEVRQWRVLPVPVSAIKSGAINTLSIRAGTKPVTIYGDYESESARRRHPPDFFNFSPDKFVHDPFKKDGRLINYIGVPIVRDSCKLETSSSCRSDDLSASPGLQTGEYRILLATSRLKPVESIMNGNAMETVPVRWKKLLEPDDFDPILTSSSGISKGEIRINKSTLKYCKSNSSTVKLPDSVGEMIKNCDSFMIRFRGMVKSKTGSGAPAGICVTLQGGETFEILPSTPSALESKPDWSEFVLEDRVPSSRFPNRVDSLVVALFPGPWEQVAAYGPSKRSGDFVFRDMEIEIWTDEEPYISDIHDLCIK